MIARLRVRFAAPQAATPIVVTDRGASQPNAVRPAQWGPRLTRIHVVRNLWT